MVKVGSIGADNGVMTARPTRGAGTATTDHSWGARPWAARALRAVIVVSPALFSLVATWVVSPLLYRPAGFVGMALFIVQLGVVGFTVAVLVEHITRRFVPLANLLGMSLVFPDNAPSRFGVALRSGTVRQLEKEVEYLRENGLSTDSAEAASQLLVLVNALGKHERLTRGHTERVRAYCDLIGEEMDLPPEQQELLHWGALIHDVGKLAVPAPILSKEERLEDAEWETIKLHPEVGAALVQPLEEWLGEWRLAASEHHERWDGGGYPLGLSGTQISLAGRIVAVADTYDVITSSRSYKTSASADEARKELVRCAGSQFDPTVVRAFLAVSVGRLHPVAGRFAWLANIGNALQAAPAAIQTAAVGTVGALGVTAAVAAGAVQIPPDPGPSVERAATVALTPAGDPLDGAAETSTTQAAPRTASSVPAPAPATTLLAAESAGLDFPSIPQLPTAVTTDGSGPTTTSDGSSGTTTVSTPVSSSTTSTTSTSIPSSSSTSSTTSTSTTSTSTTSTSTSVPAGGDCARARSGDDDLEDADLERCDLSGLDLEDADLDGANLKGALLDGTILDGADIRGANLTLASGVGTDFGDARLDDAVLVGSVFPNANFRKANLHRTDLSGAVFTGASFYDGHLENANATGATFHSTNVEKLRLKHTNLTNASFVAAFGHPTDHEDATWANTTCSNGAAQSSDCWDH
ncbi:MAG: HD domain-containing phosphohydrolase [Acidimicrobiales bacterium]